MIFRRLTSIAAAVILMTSAVAAPASAQGVTGSIRTGLDQAAGTSYTKSNPDLYSIVGGLIQVALTLVGVLLLIYLIYAGFLWMTAAGDGKKVTEAKEILKNVLIGIVIIFSAYAIANFVLTSLTGIGGGIKSAPAIPGTP